MIVKNNEMRFYRSSQTFDDTKNKLVGFGCCHRDEKGDSFKRVDRGKAAAGDHRTKTKPAKNKHQHAQATS